VDSRIVSVRPLDAVIVKDLELEWLTTGENEEYLSNEFLQMTTKEVDALREASEISYRILLKAAEHAVKQGEWKLLGIPPHAIDLVKYSLANEMDTHLLGRFDFSGGMDGVPIKLLEINADTCSLLAETAYIQEQQWKEEEEKLGGSPYNPLIEELIERFRRIINQNPDRDPTLLISTLGYEEDWINADVVAEAAREAGFEEVESAILERVIFSPEEGIFLEEEDGAFVRYDFWYKFIPWDFIAYEEPNLFDDLERLIIDKKVVVLNPAYTMLLQSKALLKYAYDLYPENPYLLKTTFSAADFPDFKYVAKPIYGRMGENISFYDGKPEPIYKTEGDYDDLPVVYQELAPFNFDLEGHRYQPSIFWTGMTAGLCFRRQDDLVIDDDAEFVGHIVLTPS